jgi:signal transduction histidine kinase/CheY-like chemotaxis protein/HPt (histidine-containing phosphotransfer) domain-containing protein
MQEDNQDIRQNLVDRLCNKITSLRYKFLLLVIVILSVTMSTAAYFDVHNERQQLTQQLEDSGRRLGNFLSVVSPEAVLSYDMILLGNYMQRIGEQQDVVYGAIRTADNKLLARHIDTSNPEINTRYDLVNEDGVPRVVDANLLERLSQEDSIISLVFPVMYDNELIASLHIGMSTERIHGVIVDALIRSILINFIIIAILGLCIYAVFRLKILIPLHQLMHSSSRVAKGDLNEKIDVTSNDELGCLAKSFNEMTDALNNSYREKDEALQILQQTNLALEQSNIALEQSTRAKSQFLANMSHEIRTPLTAIIGFGEMLMDPAISDEEASSAKQTIIRSGKHLLAIINDILDLSKIEANKLSLTPARVSPFEVIAEVDSLIGMQAREKGLNCHVNYSFPLPTHITTDPMRLKQVMINLCSNAVKFTNRGSIQLNVSYDQHNNHMIFEVVDTGIGITDAQKKSIFEAFTQADSSSIKRYAGTGLGLHLSKWLVDMLGGDISVESDLGAGSRFRFSIDAGELDHQEFVNEVQDIDDIHVSSQRAGIQQRRGHILIVEDNQDNQNLISFYVRQFGADSSIGRNGLDAIEKALSGNFDLILMDIQMPVMDGLQATSILRSRGYDKPIVALTANAFIEDRERCLNAGCDDFLPKPIERDHFEQVLDSYLPEYPAATTPSQQQPASAGNDMPVTTHAEGEPIFSTLVQGEPELSYIVSGYVGRLSEYESRIDTAATEQDWASLRRVFHDIRGTGTSMGYPMLTDIATNAGAFVREEKFDQLDEAIGQLHEYCDRIRAGHSILSSSQAS